MERWGDEHIKGAKRGLTEKKTKARALADDLKVSLQRIKNLTGRNGQQWANAERDELLRVAKSEAQRLQVESLPVLDSIQTQLVYYSTEYRSRHDRVTARPSKLALDKPSFMITDADR